MLVETRRNLLPGGRGSAWLVNYDYVKTGQQRLLLAKRLSNNSFNAVACRGSATMLLGDCQTKPRDVCRIAPAEYGKQVISAAGGFVEHAAECRCFK